MLPVHRQYFVNISSCSVSEHITAIFFPSKTPSLHMLLPIRTHLRVHVHQVKRDHVCVTSLVPEENDVGLRRMPLFIRANAKMFDTCTKKHRWWWFMVWKSGPFPTNQFHRSFCTIQYKQSIENSSEGGFMFVLSIEKGFYLLWLLKCFCWCMKCFGYRWSTYSKVGKSVLLWSCKVEPIVEKMCVHGKLQWLEF